MPDRELARLADDAWDAFLAADPVQGTAIGDNRYGDRLAPIGTGERTALRDRFSGLAARLAEIDPGPLALEDGLSHASLQHAIGSHLTLLETDAQADTVDAMNGPQAAFLNIPSLQPLRDAADGDLLRARWHAMGPWIDEKIAALRRGMAAGRAPIAVPVERVISQLDDLAARPVDEWPLLEPLREAHEGWPAGAWERFAADLELTVRDEVAPAIARYRAFLAARVLPQARDEAHAGLVHLPGGGDRYAALAHVHTTTGLTPHEIHDIGLTEIERIDAEIAELGHRVLGTGGRAATLAALRADPALCFTTGDEVMAVAERSLRAAEAALPSFFGRVPRTPCEVIAMPPHEEQHSTIAYYREPSPLTGRPGRYYVNTWKPETRPRYEAEALAFHEAVPGHHTQIAIGQELDGLPLFRRHADVTAFIEGWGLYAERLADEMGLYSGDLDRIGMLSYDAWRASRLVVDTGMHALGWSRSRAIAFMTEHTALAVNNITNEVDRYLGWPGQALAYKIGQLELRRLRADAQAALGARFDVRSFHDAVLGHGALPLSVVRGAVARDLEVAI